MARTMFLALAVILATFNMGDCLRCYTCTSSTHPACRDPFNYNTNGMDVITEDCASNVVTMTNQKLVAGLRAMQPYSNINNIPFTPGLPKACHKIVFTTGETIRTCLDSSRGYEYGTRNATCQTWVQNGVNLRFCSSCEGESCNGATTHSLSVLAGTLSLLLSYFLLKQ